MNLTIGFSPCPNDTFIFDGLLHGKVDTEGLTFQPVIEDVEALNQMAFSRKLDVTKLSYHAFAHLVGQYALLRSGSALGKNCGPLLIARRPMSDTAIETASIAIPGRTTTANFLLSAAFPRAKLKKEMLFSSIEGAVLNGEVDAGLIIHENRFTYEAKGLVKLLDLGEFWEKTTGLPIPLGGIAVRRDLPLAIQQKMERALRQSVAYAFEHRQEVMPFVREHAQEMDDSVMASHIDLYVTRYTLDLGEEGQRAVEEMFRIAVENGTVPPISDPIFVTPN
jgi:Predicted periplasmic solute-binding protein